MYRAKNSMGNSFAGLTENIKIRVISYLTTLSLSPRSVERERSLAKVKLVRKFLCGTN